MKQLLFITIFYFLLIFRVSGQLADTSKCPTVTVELRLPKEKFKFGEDIPVIITLWNTTKTKQYVFYDQYKSTTGGPAWTSVSLIEKNTGKSVLKYANKAILESKLLTDDEIYKYTSLINPGEFIASRYSLFDLVVLKTEKLTLQKGSYIMYVNYCSNVSGKINFTVE